MNRGSFFGMLFAGFIIGVVLLILVNIDPQDYRNAVWQAQNSAPVKTSMNWMPCIILIVIGLVLLPWFLSAFGGGFNFSSSYNVRDHQRELQLFTDDYMTVDTGDRLSTRLNYMPRHNVFIVRSQKGRTFMVGIGEDGRAGFVEVDRNFNYIGKPVVANEKSYNFGKDPNEELARHLKKRVERKRDPDRNDQ